MSEKKASPKVDSILKGSKLLSKYSFGTIATPKQIKKQDDPKLAAREKFLKSLNEQIEFHKTVVAGGTFLVKRYKPNIKKTVETEIRPWWEGAGAKFNVYMKFGPERLNEFPFVADNMEQVGEIFADLKAEAEAGVFDDVLFEISSAKSASRAGKGGRPPKVKVDPDTGEITG